ncbi:pectinesterase family protein [Parabacteroides sp. FAFU027]|uniref:pectinesterase family protein n=1 Tax=Parabacteroides sp. FAFU027 TaxID=2922715 RepID=UPI001FAFCAA3|nr:pectinesterase family protein [Parabacteroides sp. FAFU027]
MKKISVFLIAMLFAAINSWSEEKLLYSDNFQTWATTASSTTPTAIDKTTDFSKETLTFTLSEVSVDSAGTNTKFNYNICTAGYLMCAKTTTPYIQTSALKSVTRIYFVEAATGSSRGFQVWKKADGDADWVSIYNSYATPAGGDSTTISIPGNNTNVQLKFTNLNSAQNAYLTDLKIWGDYTSTAQQVTLLTSGNIAEAGTIIRTPASDKYDINTSVKLTAAKAFGYKFIKWVDGSDNELSTDNPYNVVLDADKTIKAVFEPVSTFNYNVNIQGSQWGKVTLNPSPTNGKYETGTVVTMSAIPNAVTNFLNWEDQTTGLSRTIQVISDTTFTASFDEIPFIVGWNFSAQTPNSERQGDYYSETSNIGLFSLKNADGTTANWSASTGLFSPSYPCIRMSNPAANFSTPRYCQTSFSTVGYRNIRIKSMVGGSYHMYPVVKLQYSVDGVTFTDRKQVDVTPVYNSGWVNLNDTLPAEAEGLTRLYVRWIEDTNSSPLLGNATDIDGTTLTNIYVYADKVVINDEIAPTLISTVPAEGSTSASANGSIVLTFDEKLKAGTGSCTLGSTALTPSFGSKTVTFAYSKLSYNTDYTFTVPAGALTDIAGNPYAGITIHFKTMNRPQPIAKVFDAIVAKDGSGTYTTIQAAIDAAPSGATNPYLIFVKNGTYNEHVDIPSTKPFIHMIGQYRDSVVITDNRLSGEDGDPNTPTYSVDPGATVVVKSNDCYFENITFSNSYGYLSQAGPQALALYTNNDKMIFKNCWMRSYQDTYLTASKMGYRGYVADCKIEGAVDFIYGQGDFYFDKCTIYCVRPTGGYIVAPNHSVGTQWGYVFSNCTIDGNKGVVTYLGRPWHEAPKTSFFNTICKISIYPAGWWYKMGGIPAIFADYNTMDANGNLLDLSQRISQYEYDVTNTDGSITTVKGTAKNSFTDAEAAQFTYENVTKGTDGWDPKVKTEKTEAPVVTVSGSSVSWNAVDYAICYVVTLNGKVVNVNTSTSYQPMTSGAVKVQAVSEFGALSVMSNSVQINNVASAVKPNTGDEIRISQYAGYALLNNLPENARINVFNFSGMLLYSKKCTTDNITIPVNQNLVLQVITPDAVKVFKLLNR